MSERLPNQFASAVVHVVVFVIVRSPLKSPLETCKSKFVPSKVTTVPIEPVSSPVTVSHGAKYGGVPIIFASLDI